MEEPKPQPSVGREGLLVDSEGVVFVEYLALLTLVTMIGAIAVVGLGLPLLRMFRAAQLMVALPIP